MGMGSSPWIGGGSPFTKDNPPTYTSPPKPAHLVPPVCRCGNQAPNHLYMGESHEAYWAWSRCPAQPGATRPTMEEPHRARATGRSSRMAERPDTFARMIEADEKPQFAHKTLRGYKTREGRYIGWDCRVRVPKDRTGGVLVVPLP